MNYLKIFIASFICLISCTSKDEGKKTIDGHEFKTDFFRMSIPTHWVTTKGKSIDAHLLTYFISGEDTIFQEISCYANNLTEEEPVIKPKTAEHLIDPSTRAELKIIFIDDKKLEKGIDIDKFRKQNVNYSSIDGFEIKVITPRETGVGMTGFYCDSIGNDNAIGRIRVNMFGENLTSQTQKELLKAISTLQFEKK